MTDWAANADQKTGAMIMEEKATYRISTSVNEGIVEIIITGELTKETMDKLHDEALKSIGEGNGKAVLCDIRNLKGPQEIAAAYFRVRSVPANFRIMPLAVVERPGNWEFKSFYETTAANAGQSMKWFEDIESARAWLKSKLEE